jgi:hypothetical protein
VPDLQALAESQIKSVSDALNKRTAAVEATAALLSRHEGVHWNTGFLFVRVICLSG